MNQITYEERKAVYEQAVKKWGEEHQLNKFDEEIGEFLTEWGRIRNNEGDRNKFAEELADATIMLEQLRMIFGVNELVCAHMDLKVLRLKQRLGIQEGENDG